MLSPRLNEYLTLCRLFGILITEGCCDTCRGIVIRTWHTSGNKEAMQVLGQLLNEIWAQRDQELRRLHEDNRVH